MNGRPSYNPRDPNRPYIYTPPETPLPEVSFRPIVSTVVKADGSVETWFHTYDCQDGKPRAADDSVPVQEPLGDLDLPITDILA